MASLRRKEASKARWGEFDLYGEKPRWTVPGIRMKKTNPSDPLRDHIVPLTPDLIELLEFIPRFDGFVFSTCGGKKAIADFVGIKEKVDALMKEELGEKFGRGSFTICAEPRERHMARLAFPKTSASFLSATRK